MDRRSLRPVPFRSRPMRAAAVLALAGLAFLLAIGPRAMGIATGAPGDLDASFSGDGMVIVDFPDASIDVAEDVVVLPDGRIVAAGRSSALGGMDFGLAAFLPDGTLDTGFSDDGLWYEDLGGANGVDDRAFAIAVQSDGKIIVAGTSEVPADDWNFVVLRFLPNGELDTTFGDQGQWLFGSSADDRATAVAVMADDRIVVAGTSDAGANNDLLVARLLPDGQLDPSFAGGDGHIYQNLMIDDRATALALEPDGDIVVAGQSSSTSVDFAVARFTAAGALDPSFGGTGTGFVLVDFTVVDKSDDFALGMARQPDGRLVVVGSAKVRGTGHFEDFALARLTADGVLDASFSGDGLVLTDFEARERADVAFDVAIQADGTIVAAGETNAQGNHDFALAQYTRGGDLDTSFSSDGMARADLGGQDYGRAAALQPDGRIVVAGETNNGEQNDFALARFFGSDVSLATATATSNGTGTVVPTAAASSTATGTIAPTAAGSATATGTIAPTTAASSTATGTTVPTAHATATATATATNAATNTPTVQPTSTPGACDVSVDVLLLGTYENEAERLLLAAHLDDELARFALDTGHTAADALYPRAAIGRPTYRAWLNDLMASGFRGRDGAGVELPCATDHVMMASYDDVAALRAGLAALDGLLGSGTIARADFLARGIDDVRMPPRIGIPAAQLALPWRRGTCADSFQHLAAPKPADGRPTPDVAFDLIAHLVRPEAQRARFDLHVDDDVDQARLAYPSLAAPYTAGWPEGGGVIGDCSVSVMTRPDPDPDLVEAMVKAADELADALAAAVDALGAGEYSSGPDRQNPVYTYGSAFGVSTAGPGDLVILATKMLMDRPITRQELEDRMAGKGMVIGEFGTLTKNRLPAILPAGAPSIFIPFSNLGVAPAGAQARFAVLLRGDQVILVDPSGAEISATRAAEIIRSSAAQAGVRLDGIEVELLPLEDAPPVLGTDIELRRGSVCICIKVDRRKIGIKIK